MTATRVELPGDLPSLDAESFEIRVPHETFAFLRSNDPVHWIEPSDSSEGYWAVTLHEDVVSVTRDPETFSSQAGGTTLEDIPHEHIEARRTLIDTDGHQHEQMRRLVSPRFTPSAVRKGWTGFVNHLVRATMEEALGGGESSVTLDVVEKIASVVPIRVLGELLGIAPQDHHLLMHLGDEMIASADPDHAPRSVGRAPDDKSHASYPFNSPAGKDLWDYADKLRRERTGNLGEDIFSLLMTGQIDGRTLSSRELDNFFSMLVVAGNETTRMALAHGIHALAQSPDQFEVLKAEPEPTIPLAVEEILRWSTPLHYFRRTATRDCRLRDKDIREGDKVVMWYVSANRDEAVFDDPFRFDVRRTPNRHLAFGGGGAHFCLGNGLARLEIAAVLRALTERVASLEVAGDVSRTRSDLTHGVKSLPVHFILA